MPADIIRIEIPTPFPIGSVNAFLVRRGDEHILFDTGPRIDEAYEALLTNLREHGLEPPDLAAIVATHGHLDHVGNMGQLRRDAPRVPTYAHPMVIERLQRHDDEADDTHAYFFTLMLEFGVPQDIAEDIAQRREGIKSMSEAVQIEHPVEDEAEVLGFRAYHVPGHSPTDTLFVDVDSNEAIAGDHVLTVVNPNPLLRRPDPGQPRGRSLVEYQHSLRRTRALGLAKMHPGHGGVIENPIEAIDWILGRHAKRCASLVDALAGGAPATPYDLVRKVYPDLAAYWTDLGISSVVGHLELLEEQGKVRFQHADGTLLAYAMA